MTINVTNIDEPGTVRPVKGHARGEQAITVKSDATIDFESRSSYAVTITATDTASVTATADVTINVTNIDEPGTVALSKDTPAVNRALTATLVDQDGSVSGESWTWSRGNTRTGTFTPISGADTADYTPVAGDVGKYLKAAVGYTDSLGSGKSAEKVSDNPTATDPPPVFANASETFTVNENATSGTVGTVTAMDEDNDTLNYSVGGTDVAAFNGDFSLNASTGAITVKSDATIDFETGPSYVVTITATDPSGGTDTIDVAISVTNADDPGVVSLNPAVPRVNVAVTATLSDPDGSVTEQMWQWQSGNSATGPFSNIAGATANSYTPVQGDLGKFLKAKVIYTDAFGSGKMVEATASNAVNPAGPNQPPAFPSNSQTVTVDENATSGNLGLSPATDPENHELAYSVTGTDQAAFLEDFSLQPVTAALRVKSDATIDYESRRSYRVTISVHDGRNTAHNPDTTIDDTLVLTINVNNLDEPGAVEISSKNPEVGDRLQATVTDPDGNVRSTSWQWSSRSGTSGSFDTITVATESSYTPVASDVNRYLRVVATYTDGQGAGKQAEAITQKKTIPESTNQAASFRSERITLNVPENSPNHHLVGDVSATDPNGDQLYYQLHHASVLDYQADFFERVFNLGYTDGLITVRDDTLLNYEGSEPLIVTIKLTDDLDPFGNRDKTWVWDDTTTLTINVTNVDEPGTLDLEHVRSTTGAPTEVDTSFARLSDPDGVNRIVSWEWFRGDTASGPFTEIDSGPFSDGTQSGFRPEESDIGKYLKVKVTYADVFSTKVIEQIMGPVERWVSPHPDYAFWPGRWTDSGDLAVGGTQTGVIQGGFLANGRYIRDVPEFFELTGMNAGTTYEVNLSGPGYGVSDIMGFYTIDTDGGGLFFKSRGDGQPDVYTSAQIRHVLFTPSSADRIFMGITGAFAAENLTYTVALSSR